MPTKPDPAPPQIGDTIAVETPRASGSWRFGIVRSAPGGQLLIYTALGKANTIANWQYRLDGERHRTLITGDPTGPDQQARRLAFREQAGAATTPLTTAEVAALVDTHKPL